MIFTEFFMMGGKVYAQSDGSRISGVLSRRSQDGMMILCYLELFIYGYSDRFAKSDFKQTIEC